MADDRSSYDIRVCDDLSEVVLQFLPLKYKSRFECVSKQFQRTVFKKHNQLLDGLFHNKECHDFHKLEALLKNMKNITHLGPDVFEHPLEDQEINLIVKHCPHLKKIECDLNFSSESVRRYFGTFLGPTLVSLKPKVSDIPMIVEYFSNLKELQFVSSTDSPQDFCHFSGLQFKKLEKFSMNSNDFSSESAEHLTNLRQFIANNKSINNLSLVFGFPLKAQNYKLLFNEIYVLNNLVHLNIDTRVEITSASLGMAFNQMPAICLKLKSLTISDILIGEQTSDERLIEELKKLKQLKRLDLTMSMTSDPNLTSIEEHFNECFKHLEGLTHLRLKFPDSHEIQDTLIKDLDIYCPLLKSLAIGYRFMSTEQTVHTLRRIQNLESLDLQNAGLKNIDELLNDCQNIKNKSISHVIEPHEDWDQTDYGSDIIEPSNERMCDFHLNFDLFNNLF